MFEKKNVSLVPVFLSWRRGKHHRNTNIAYPLTTTLCTSNSPLLVRPNLNKFAPSNITNSPPSISGRPQSFTSFLDKTSYKTNSRIHFDGGKFAIGRNFHRLKQLNKNEITEAIGGLFSGEKGELFVVCLDMKHEPPKTNTTGSDNKPKCFLQKHQVWSAF